MCSRVNPLFFRVFHNSFNFLIILQRSDFESVVAGPLINTFCHCVILPAVCGYWHILLIVMGGIA